MSRVVALTHVDAYLSTNCEMHRKGGKKYASSVCIVNDFIAREESKEIIVGFESVNGCKDVLEVNCVIRICRIVSVKRISWCVDYDISVSFHRGGNGEYRQE